MQTQNTSWGISLLVSSMCRDTLRIGENPIDFPSHNGTTTAEYFWSAMTNSARFENSNLTSAFREVRSSPVIQAISGTFRTLLQVLFWQPKFQHANRPCKSSAFLLYLLSWSYECQTHKLTFVWLVRSWLHEFLKDCIHNGAYKRGWDSIRIVNLDPNGLQIHLSKEAKVFSWLETCRKLGYLSKNCLEWPKSTQNAVWFESLLQGQFSARDFRTATAIKDIVNLHGVVWGCCNWIVGHLTLGVTITLVTFRPLILQLHDQVDMQQRKGDVRQEKRDRLYQVWSSLEQSVQSDASMWVKKRIYFMQNPRFWGSRSSFLQLNLSCLPTFPSITKNSCELSIKAKLCGHLSKSYIIDDSEAESRWYFAHYDTPAPRGSTGLMNCVAMDLCWHGWMP